MRFRLLVLLALVLGLGTAAAVASSSPTEVCATATQPGRVVSVDGSPVFTSAVATATSCAAVPTVTVTTTETATTTATSTTTSTTASSPCDLYASPTGSGTGSGTQGSPLATPAQLDARLAPGQTGCLLAGTYGSVGATYRLSSNGTPTGQITITAAPGQAARVIGLVEMEGSYTTLSGLTIDGSNTAYNTERPGTTCPFPVSNGLEIDGVGDVFEGNDFYQSVPSLRGNGIGIGWNHPADYAVVRYNRIHDLGQCRAFDQMIYLAHGAGVQIYGNWLWNDSHGFGVQVYPCASGASVHSNVIDGAATGFVVETSAGCVEANDAIFSNVVENSTGNPAIGSSGQGVLTCCGASLSGDTFSGNDVFANPGGIGAGAAGLTVSGNQTYDPQFVDESNHDYRLQSGSPASGLGLWDGTNPGP